MKCKQSIVLIAIAVFTIASLMASMWLNSPLTVCTCGSQFVPGSESPQGGLGKKLPTAIIFGAAKCGTSALIHMLDLHPDVAAADGEPAFFNNETAYDHLGLSWYQSRMPPGSDDKKVVLEKSPYYFSTPRAPARIRRFNPAIKLILLVREPVLRTLSHYVHQKYQTEPANVHAIVTQHTFEEIFQFRRRVSNATSADELSRSLLLREAAEFLTKDSMYSANLWRWLQYFSLEQILVLDGDELSMDPSAVVRQAWKWLDLNPELVPDKTFYFNATKGQHCWIEPTSGKDTCLDADKGRHHPVVDPGVLREVHRFFAPYNKAFLSMTRLSLETWTV